MILSPHFTLEEAVFSSTAKRLGIDNTPMPNIIENIKVSAVGMEAVRAILLGYPIHVDSWYRCSRLNMAVGGAAASDHMQGFAIDFVCIRFGTPEDIVKAIIASNLMFDQCIMEGSWVHISFSPRNRRKVLNAHFGIAGTTYTERKPS